MSTRAERRVVQLGRDELPRGPWIFGRTVDAPPDPPEDGELVEVHDASDRFLGHALYNGASDIRLRWLSRGRRTDLDRPREFLLSVLKRADDLRRRTLRLPEVTDAYRVAHAEGDDLPGLVVDRLGEVLVCEHHALGFWRLREEVEWALRSLYPGLTVVHRMPAQAARSEGLGVPPTDGALPVEVVITEHGARFPVLPAGGHKTGWFCDQRENRARVAALARGRRVLDVCCNLGGFAVHAALAGASSVQALDLDEVALARAARAAQANDAELELVHADAFDHLRGLAADGALFDLVVVDPPKFVRNRAALEGGLKRYADLNALALARVRPGGLCFTFSCSGALELARFLGTVFGAARRAEREVRLLEVLGAGPDHPQRPDWPRSRYLKGAMLAVD